jgi:hypothetical protein
MCLSKFSLWITLGLINRGVCCIVHLFNLQV